MAWPIYAALALQAAGTGASFFQKRPKMDVPDISAELARIRALYEQARQTAVANIKQEAGQARGLAASNLATRGIYRAPVSENVFGKMREAEGRDIATAEANIGVQSADAQARMLASLMGAQQQAQQYNLGLEQQRMAGLYQGLGSLGSALFSYGMNRPEVQQQGSYTRMQPNAAWQNYGLGYAAPTQSFNQNLIPGAMVPSTAAAQFMNSGYAPSMQVNPVVAALRRSYGGMGGSGPRQAMLASPYF